MYLKLESRKSLLSLPSEPFRYLHILSIFLCQPLLLFWLRVLLLVIMLPMGLFGILADQVYLKAIQQGNFVKLEVASYLFPFEREILIGPAQLQFRQKTIDTNSVALYKEILTYDPYSVQFLGVYVQLEYLYGNKNEAKLAYKKLKLIAPNSNVLKRINETMKGLQ